MKERLIKNYVTTIIGFIIMVVCGVMVYQEKSTPTDLSGWLSVSLLFLRSKDSLINIKPDDQ